MEFQSLLLHSPILLVQIRRTKCDIGVRFDEISGISSGVVIFHRSPIYTIQSKLGNQLKLYLTC